MRYRLISLFLMLIFFFGVSSVSLAAENEDVIWQIKPKEGNYMKYFGKRVVDVNRSEADRLIPQEFGWQGNQLIFIFHLTSKQLEAPEFEFSFEIITKDYGVDEQVELDIYAGTNINNLKTVSQGLKIIRTGTFVVKIPSTHFYLGSQNFIKIFGRNVRPTGYGENPPNCRFGVFKLATLSKEETPAPAPATAEATKTNEPVKSVTAVAESAKQEVKEEQPKVEPQKQEEKKKDQDQPSHKEYVEEKALLKETAAGQQDEMGPF